MTSIPWFSTSNDTGDVSPIDDLVGHTTDEAMDAALAEHDGREAEAAREQYRTTGLPHISPDDAVAAHLSPGEGVVAVRALVSVDRDGAGDVTGAISGPLYLTTHRLMLLGGSPVTVDLSVIDELALVGERLLVSLRDGTGLDLQVAGPRLLRVQIAAALMGARG